MFFGVLTDQIPYIITNDMINAGQQILNKRNKNPFSGKSCHSVKNKQNINKNQVEKSAVAQQYQKKIQILTQSALSALIQKQEIIEQLTTIRDYYDPTLQQTQELSYKIQQLQHHNYQLRTCLQETAKQLDQQRHEWNEQHYKLTSQIQRLRDEFRHIQNSLQLSQTRNIELNHQNQLVCQQIQQLQAAYKLAKQEILANEEKIQNQAKSIELLTMEDCKDKIEMEYKYLVAEEENEKSIHQIINQQEKNKLYSLKESLSYETEQWLENHQVQTSIREQHSLKGSLQALNLIDNYSVNSKRQIIEDAESQFTSKYFKYTNETSLHLLDKTLHQSCEHIPQQPEDEIDSQNRCSRQQGSKETKIFVWIQKASYFVSGVCLGAFFVWKWNK